MRRRADETKRQARVVRYWRAVEYFSPQTIDPLTPPAQLGRRDVLQVVRLREGTPPPWEQPQYEPDGNVVWRHIVYAGIFDVAKIREVLESVLPSSETDRDHEGRQRGKSALLSITLDSNGRLFKKGVSLSSCGWAVGRCVVPPGPGGDSWLEGFDTQQKQVLQVLFGVGDGQIPIDPSGTVDSAGKRVLRAIAGVSARIALDAVTGGLASMPTLVGSIVGDHFGSIAAKVGENVASSITNDATKAVERRRDGNQISDGENADNSPAEGESDGTKPSDELGTKVLNVADLAAITRWVSEQLGVDEVLEPTEIWVKTVPVSVKRADDISGDELINSFYANDLEKVANEISAGNVGTALTSYLQAEESIAPSQRVDLRVRPEAMLGSLAPESMPLGRWPSNPAYALTLSQQFAINRIYADLMEPGARGVYAVNGPPGTGKTTMLRDLVAAVVVERAVRLAKLESPRSAFNPDTAALAWPSDEGSWTREIVPLISDLTGFEMVVASSNNGAVENITLEVPSVKAIDTNSFPEADYYAEPATLAAGEPCWGAIAARLGKRSNRNEFVQRFWWGEQDRRVTDRNGDVELLSLQKTLEALKYPTADSAIAVVPWSVAVARFNTAVEEVRQLAHERQTIADILEQTGERTAALEALRRSGNARHERVRILESHLIDLARRKTEAEAVVRRAEVAVSDARLALDNAEVAFQRADEYQQQVQTDLYNQAGNKPGWFKRIIARNALQNWEEATRPFAAAVAEADARVEAASQHWDQHSAVLVEKQRDVTNASQPLAAVRQQITRCEAELATARTTANEAGWSIRQRESELQRDADLLAQARTRWPSNVPGPEWTAAADDRPAMEQREKSSPWMDSDFAAARSRLFLAALDLHRAVLTNEPKLVWKNLRAVVDVVKGEVPADLAYEKVLAAWQMLFFFVPVVSTTFASLPTMFSALGREDLGWLFIDEAGQATPQAAVGALWRCQRAVVVGDPRQLEPVVTLPRSGQRRLSQKFGVDDRWSPGRTSVQSVTDRVNIFGTSLPDPGDQGPIWVGSPLRVHRRCDQLMFEVSNQIAYDNMMVNGVNGRDGAFPLGERNLWIHVDAPSTGDKWNREEGQHVLKILQKIQTRVETMMEGEIAEAGTDLPTWAAHPHRRQAELRRRINESVFIVSPFRNVADQLDKFLRTNRMPLDRSRLGTVHTTQGKEADIVILILGTATDQKRARQWAASTPNLLNVAITRARRRLVVIGDYDNWSRLQHFSTLARHTRPGGLLERWPGPATVPNTVGAQGA